MEMILAFGIPAWVESLGEWWFTGMMGICLYFVPLVTCLLVYFVKGVNIYFNLRKERVGEGDSKHITSWFRPDKLTVGHVVAFAFISVCPVVNLIAFFVETGWKVLKFICKKFEWVFTASLVPDSEKYIKIRREKERAKIAEEAKRKGAGKK